MTPDLTLHLNRRFIAKRRSLCLRWVNFKLSLVGQFYIAGDTDESRKNLSSAYMYARKITDENEKRAQLAPLFYGWSELRLRTGKVKHGIRSHEISSALYDLIGNPVKSNKLLVQRALIFEVTGKNSEAARQYELALEKSVQLNRADDVIRCLDGISRIAYKMNDMKLANEKNKEAAEWRKKTPILVS